MNAPMCSVKSIAGVPLVGNKLVRLTYLDDAGLFNAKQEPFIVIGGVMIDADRQMIPVEDHIQELVWKHIPEKDWVGFAFHASDLWHGGPYFKRDNWPLKKRLEILAELAEIPRQFGLVMVAGFQERALMRHHRFPPNTDDKTKELAAYNNAMVRFCESVERFMRESAPDEITMLIAEDRDTVRQLLKQWHIVYRDKDLVAGLLGPRLTYFPFERIRDTIHFAKKDESRHLQLADLCTFIFKRRLLKDEHIRPFYAAIKPRLITLPADEDEMAESW